MRKWVLLTDPDDKMAGVKVRATREFCHILVKLSYRARKKCFPGQVDFPSGKEAFICTCKWPRDEALVICNLKY